MDHGAPSAFSPTASFAFEKKPVADSRSLPFYHELIGLKTPCRTVPKETGEVLRNALASDDRLVTRLVIGAILAEQHRGALRIRITPRENQFVD